MIVRGIDSNNDWMRGKGKSDYRKDRSAVAQNIKTRLQSYLGDCFFKQSDGIDWWNLLGQKDVRNLRLAISTCILNTDGVVSMAELSVNLDSERHVKIVYSVLTAYGQLDRQETLNA